MNPVATRATTEPAVVKVLLTLLAVLFLALFLVVPLVAVFAQALEKGWAAYTAALTEPMARANASAKPVSHAG